MLAFTLAVTVGWQAVAVACGSGVEVAAPVAEAAGCAVSVAATDVPIT
jgi:hypothetical protein